MTQSLARVPCTLVLTEPTNLGETGIEIIAHPPSKRRQPLGLLSGGERALTAGALIFALLRASPTPFCVLDEVDAALDEANIGRFRNTLREAAERSQFIVVTTLHLPINSRSRSHGVSELHPTAQQTAHNRNLLLVGDHPALSDDAPDVFAASRICNNPYCCHILTFRAVQP